MYSTKGIPGRRKVPGAVVEDFVPWAPSESKPPSDLEEEDEEDEMYGLLHRYATRKRKRGAISKSVADSIPEPVGGSSHPATDGNSEVQEIVISSSPKIGLND